MQHRILGRFASPANLLNELNLNELNLIKLIDIIISWIRIQHDFSTSKRQPFDDYDVQF